MILVFGWTVTRLNIDTQRQMETCPIYQVQIYITFEVIDTIQNIDSLK